MARTATGPTVATPTGRTEGPDARFASLAALVGADQAAAFLDHSLGKDVFRARLAPEAAAALFDWPQLNTALAQHRLSPPRLRLERVGQDATKGLFRDRRSKRGLTLHDIDAGTLNARLRDGATLILDAANELSPPLQSLCEGLAAEFACACQANLYACWGATQGFDVHWDDHDVFVVQVEGRKRWSLYGATRAAPTRRDHHGEHPRPQSPVEEIVLEPGDVLYLPRGYWHAAVGLGGPTLHLTVGLTRKTGADFLHWLADRALGDPAARTDLPLERDDAILGAHLAGVLARLATESPDTLAQLYRRHVEAHQAHRPRLSFPFVGGDESRFAPDTPIALAAGAARLAPGPGPGQVVLSWRGAEFTVHAALAEPLERLLAGEALPFAAFEEPLDEAARPLARPFVAEMLGRGVFFVPAGAPC